MLASITVYRSQIHPLGNSLSWNRVKICVQQTLQELTMLRHTFWLILGGLHSTCFRTLVQADEIKLCCTFWISSWKMIHIQTYMHKHTQTTYLTVYWMQLQLTAKTAKRQLHPITDCPSFAICVPLFICLYVYHSSF